jgi:DNA-binding response OmpR family regulator
VTQNEVLLVCASPDAGNKLADMLRQDSWKVYPAESCREARHHLSELSAPVVICESHLPDGSWKDLLEDGRPLIVTDRAADEALWAEVLNLGGFDVLAQPFDPTEVSRVVASAGRSDRTREHRPAELFHGRSPLLQE